LAVHQKLAPWSIFPTEHLVSSCQGRAPVRTGSLACRGKLLRQCHGQTEIFPTRMCRGNAKRSCESFQFLVNVNREQLDVANSTWNIRHRRNRKGKITCGCRGSGDRAIWSKSEP